MTIITPPGEHNLFFLVHLEEEQLRIRSLSELTQDKKLEDELLTVEQATKMIVAITQEYKSKNDDEGLILHLSIRLANIAFSATKLALSGYYQQSIALSRDIIETGFLIHYFVQVPSEMQTWRDISDNERKKKFAPVKIRIELDKLEGCSELGRAKVYADGSEFGSHASPRGFSLLRSNDIVMVGPFFELTYLRLCVRELFMRLCPVAHIIVNYLSDLPDEVRLFNLVLAERFIEVAKRNDISASQPTENTTA